MYSEKFERLIDEITKELIDSRIPWEDFRGFIWDSLVTEAFERTKNWQKVSKLVGVGQTRIDQWRIKNGFRES